MSLPQKIYLGEENLYPPPNHTPHAQISDEATVLRPPWMKWL